MQFRERSRVIQVIRTVYDPAIKRGRAEVVARLDKDALEIGDDVRRACSPAELAELEAFLAARNALMSRETTRQAAETLAALMRQAEAFFRSSPSSTTGSDGSAVVAGMVAADIYTAWEDLKKAMHKAGYRKAKDGH